MDQSIEHEIGHATFAIMRELFSNEWCLNDSELNHIMEEYYMQIYSDLVDKFWENLQVYWYDR